jgi:hypothetical protein
MWEDIALWVIVIQGFFVMYFEYDVWRIKRARENERALWREQKRKQAVAKVSKSSASVIGEQGL